jgi:dihydroorotase
MLCENPATLYGISGKGRIEKGFDADLVLVDLKRAWTIEKEWLQSKCGWSPFEGMSIHGRIEHVLLRGAPQVRDGALVGAQTGEVVQFDWK